MPPGASEVYGRPTAAPRRAAAAPRPSVARRPMARAQVGVLRPPQYSPGNSQQSLDSLRIWQEELQHFLAGVPVEVHGYYPHRSICKLFLNGGGEGSGFWIEIGRAHV